MGKLDKIHKPTRKIKKPDHFNQKSKRRENFWGTCMLNAPFALPAELTARVQLLAAIIFAARLNLASKKYSRTKSVIYGSRLFVNPHYGTLCVAILYLTSSAALHIICSDCPLGKKYGVFKEHYDEKTP